MKTDTPMPCDIDPPTYQPNRGFEAIKTEVEAAMSQRSVTGVTVEVSGADVTLSGHVASRSERQLVGLAAWGTPGVRKVINDILVDELQTSNTSAV